MLGNKRKFGGTWGVGEAMIILKIYTFLLIKCIKALYFSAENNSSLEADNHFKPSPRPRSMLKKHSHGEKKDSLGDDKETVPHEELEAHSTPSFLPRLNGRQPEAEKNAFSENLDPEVSTVAELCFEFRYLRLIMRERETICVHACVCLCVFYMFSSANDKELKFFKYILLGLKLHCKIKQKCRIISCTAKKEENC